ncbi:MAG: hypothetical protein KKG75_04315 [Nanoarchaeota archaeon]|nr:hypothetical protein [Nanoarchaeota archaeon]
MILKNRSVVPLWKVKELFEDTKQITNNFENINPSLLLYNTKRKYSPSSRLLIFRLV